MFSACCFCRRPLGTNEMFETFPVGSRLAFDGDKGRLWVVCTQCGRWNLSPLEERWEAIEHAERLYRDTRKRVATDNIGLARLRDGTTIVRIGKPLRPEFAAWRYGDQFGRRRRTYLLAAGGAVVAGGGAVVGSIAAGLSLVAVGLIATVARNVYSRPNEIVASIAGPSGAIVRVRRWHLGMSTLGLDENGSLQLRLRSEHTTTTFTGRDAERVAAIVIPKVNRAGGSRTTVQHAVDEIERRGGSEGFMERFPRLATTYTRTTDTSPDTIEGATVGEVMTHGLLGIPREYSLALEMALHEEAERRAMQGELAELERAWREAEEIAAISDTLLVSPGADEAYEKLKAR